MVKRTYKYIADMGGIRIESHGVAFFFENGMGDGRYKVTVSDNDISNHSWAFVGTFEVNKGSTAHLKEYDGEWNGKDLHVFRKGRYPVYNKDGDMFIGKWK